MEYVVPRPENAGQTKELALSTQEAVPGLLRKRDSSRPLKILSFSSLFPNPIQPTHGIFLQHRLAHLAKVPGVEVRMVAPVPFLPSAMRRIERYGAYVDVPSKSAPSGIQTRHPRYPVIPKIGMTVAPALMAAALLPEIRRIRAEGFDFDVIDAYYLYPDGVAAALIAKAMRRPLLLTAFGTDVNLLPTFATVRPQVLWAVRQSVAVTCVCRALADRLVELGIERDKTDVILHGVDLDLFHPPSDRAELRRNLKFERPTLLSVGHLIERKGHGFVIDAMRNLPGVDLVIAGSGPLDSALRQRAERMGVADRVRFVGNVNQGTLAGLMGAADALVLCSDREGLANVLVEAMACGTPVAATPVWGSPEAVQDWHAGVLLADRSSAAVVEGVRELLGHRRDRQRTRAWAEQFSWPDAARRHATHAFAAI
ncbi:glycosyltransferase [Sabulicella rubraurantiaca]|uniref:glycosyltransferase n=1 Tax=Sabulicella rubraurantiaca TaxID=2811429 RepID=UPI001A97ADC4|nr:glycosyltransferase [Sabulicella rubraurantiaca]